MGDDVDAGGTRPPALERVVAIRLVQKQEPVGRTCRRRNLCQAHGGMKQPARPRLVEQAGGVIVEHALVVEVLEAVQSRNNRSAVQRAAAPRREPQPLGAGDIDDVVRTISAEHVQHGAPRHNRPDSLTDVRITRSSEGIAQQDVAAMPHGRELLAQLEQHLRRPEARIRRIVADEKDAHAATPRSVG